MSHSLDLADIDIKSSLDDVLTVSCYARMSKIAVFRHLGIDVLHDRNRTHYRVTLVGCIVCIYELALLVDYYGLCRRRTCIKTKIKLTLLVLDIKYGNLVFLMTLIESGLILFALEDGIDPDDIRNEAFPVLKLYEKL